MEAFVKIVDDEYEDVNGWRFPVRVQETPKLPAFLSLPPPAIPELTQQQIVDGLSESSSMFALLDGSESNSATGVEHGNSEPASVVHCPCEGVQRT